MLVREMLPRPGYRREVFLAGALRAGAAFLAGAFLAGVERAADARFDGAAAFLAGAFTLFLAAVLVADAFFAVAIRLFSFRLPRPKGAAS